MKRFFFMLSVVALVLTSSAVLAQMKDAAWDLIPDLQKAHLITRDYSGSRDLSIMCYAVTELTAAMLDQPSAQYFSEMTLGGNCMMVYVGTYGSGHFWPLEFDFTQGYTQYEIGYGDFLEIKGPFSGGQIRSGTVATGMIRIPDGIDLGRTFMIWYEDESAVLGPMSFTSKGNVFIESTGSGIERLLPYAQSHLTDWVLNSGYLPTEDRSIADLIVSLGELRADASRQFNWWFLALPAWPFMPVTTVDSEVALTMSIADSSGTQILSLTGEGRASFFLLADLYSREWARTMAATDAFLRLLGASSLP